MANQDRVLHGAVAIIKVNGIAIGYMRSVTIQENITRNNVYQLGSILPVEMPASQWAGTVSCGFYEINWNRSGIKGAMKRDVQNNTEYENNVVLDYDGVQLDVYKRERDVIDPETKKITAKESPYCVIRRCLINSDSINIQEGQVSGRDQSFGYLDPVITPN